jgi:hypothetical protein
MGHFDTAAVTLLGQAFAVFVLIALAAAFVVRLRPALDSNCRVRRRKLDRGQRFLDARLGSSNTLRTSLARVRAEPSGE